MSVTLNINGRLNQTKRLPPVPRLRPRYWIEKHVYWRPRICWGLAPGDGCLFPALNRFFISKSAASAAAKLIDFCRLHSSSTIFRCSLDNSKYSGNDIFKTSYILFSEYAIMKDLKSRSGPKVLDVNAAWPDQGLNSV